MNDPVGEALAQQLDRVLSNAQIQSARSFGLTYLCCLLILRAVMEAGEIDRNSGHRLVLPERSMSWSSIWRGHDLSKMARHIEDTNPFLKGVLTSVDFDSRDLGGTRDERESVLRRLLFAVSDLNVFDRGIDHAFYTLAVAVERVLELHAHELKSLALPAVTDLMIDLLQPEPHMRFCDPTCGSGYALAKLARRLRDSTRSADVGLALTLHGQEKNLDTWSLCRMNMTLHAAFDARIEQGDVLRAPALVEHGQLLKYDRVLAQPPFNLSNWGVENAKWDPYHRFSPIPPASSANFAFIQHCAAILAPGGVAAILCPNGVLFRGGAEAKIREHLLKEGMLDAVLALPSGMLPTTSIPATIMMLRKTVRSHGQVLLVNATSLGVRQGRRKELRPEEHQRIVECVARRSEQPGFSRLVTLEEIAEREWSLNIASYVSDASPGHHHDAQEHLHAAKSAEAERDAAARRLDEALKNLFMHISRDEGPDVR